MPTVNILQQVITYNDSGLAYLINAFAFIKTANKKFKEFNKMPKNLGDTVSFDKPPRMTSTGSLVVTFQGVEQRTQNLTVNKEESVAYEFTAQQFIFNVRDYMEKFGKSAIRKLGTTIESDIAGLAESNTYRFYGDGVTPISTSLQLANALAQFRAFSAAPEDTRGYLDMQTYPPIINSNLAQFVIDRNNKESMSWMLGKFSDCEWYQSNLLKLHLSGTEGNAGTVLTVVSTTTDADGGVISITFSGTTAASDPNSIKQYDKFQFNDGVAGQTNIRFLTWDGYIPTSLPVQFRATANAASTAGSQVTVNIFPPLQAAAGRNQNVSRTIVAGMQVSVLPDHRCGLITSGNPMFLAMPELPDEDPYKTSSAVDDVSGASIRMYYGSQFGQNQRGNVHDVIWGKTLVDEYSMMVALPA